MGQMFSITRHTHRGVVSYRTWNHYKGTWTAHATKREATAQAKRIERLGKDA